MAMTRGRIALLALLQVTTARRVAERCGVHPAQVSRWASGQTVPSEVARMVLESSYGIESRSWVASATGYSGKIRA